MGFSLVRGNSAFLGMLLLGIMLFKEASAVMGDSFFEYDEYFKRYGRLYKVPWRLIKAIAMNESDLGRAKSVALGILEPSNVSGSASYDGLSWGIMQTTLSTARMMEGMLVTEKYLNDPENSIRIGVKYLKWLRDRNGGDEEKTVRGYNGGPGYLKTRLGPSMTLVYWGRYLKNKALIQAKQPGDWNEI